MRVQGRAVSVVMCVCLGSVSQSDGLMVRNTASPTERRHTNGK